jgi:hypothetical protein
MSNQTTAKEILTQLGGNKFVTMTGARALVATKNGLRFMLPARFAKDGINFVEVELTGADLYDVTYSKARGATVKEVAKDQGIYADMLKKCFTEATGLNTSL